MDVDLPPLAHLPLFDGLTRDECAHFIHTMWVVGTAAGKDNDDQWMVALAKSSFTGYAARWFEARSRNAEFGWRDLARAIVLHWSSDNLYNELSGEEISESST